MGRAHSTPSRCVLSSFSHLQSREPSASDNAPTWAPVDFREALSVNSRLHSLKADHWKKRDQIMNRKECTMAVSDSLTFATFAVALWACRSSLSEAFFSAAPSSLSNRAALSCSYHRWLLARSACWMASGSSWARNFESTPLLKPSSWFWWTEV